MSRHLPRCCCPLDHRRIFLCGNKSSRIFIFALWSCDFEFPMEQCSSSAISRCAYPSTSCRSKICRHPPGSSSMARPRAIRSIAPRRFRSSFSTSRLTDGESLDTGASSESTGGDLRRNFISYKAAVALQCPVRNGGERQGTGFGCTLLVPRVLNQRGSILAK